MITGRNILIPLRRVARYFPTFTHVVFSISVTIAPGEGSDTDPPGGSTCQGRLGTRAKPATS
jgi:hypothetical protein